MTVLQLKFTLRHVDPPVWRSVLVPDGTRLDSLSAIIELAMGWDDPLHGHMFTRGRIQLKESQTLRDALPKRGPRLLYTYDFGDTWEHDIVLEGRPDDPGVTLPACIDGGGACPPGDCGGPVGYEVLKEALANPEHEEYWDRVEWMGLESGDEFDPSEFSADEVDRRLKEQLRTPG
jgi:hypothetical protein